MNKNNTKLDQLTSLRFFAAFMIVIHHSNGLFGIQHSNISLHQGVSFFFVLSGFILTYVYPSLSTWIEIKQFWKARIARIVPAYFASFLFAISLISYHWDIKTAIAYLLMIQAWIPSSDYYFSYNAVAWSVSTEFFFYLTFPFLLYKWNQTWLSKLIISIIVLITLMVVSDACHLAIYKPPHNGFVITENGLININPLARIFEFIVGMFIALLYKKRKDKIKKNNTFFLETMYEIISIILCVFFICYINNIAGWIKVSSLSSALNQWLINNGGVFVFGLLIYILAQGRGKISKILSNPYFVWLGEISFSMYLTHQILIKLYKNNISYFLDIPNIILFTVFMFILLLVSFLMWAYVEMPGRRFILGYKKTNPSTIVKNILHNNLTKNYKLLFTVLIIISSIGLLQSKISINNSINKIENVLPTDFNPLTYIRLNPDIEKSINHIASDEKKIELSIKHYLTHGKKENRQYTDKLPINFNPFIYINLYTDLKNETKKMTSDEEKIEFAKKHYLSCGKKEGRKYYAYNSN